MYQRALISTALPRRGVTTQSSDLGVHPGELIALGALAQQAVGGIDADAEARAAQVVLDDVDAASAAAAAASSRSPVACR